MAARNFPIRSPREEESDAAVRGDHTKTLPRSGSTTGHPDTEAADADFFGPAKAVLLGLKNAAISGTVVAVPTLVGCRVLPWAKANLNYTAQALIISAACIAGFFITADKTILRNARQNTIGKVDKST